MKANLMKSLFFGWIKAFTIIVGTTLILAFFLRFTDLGEQTLSWLTFTSGCIALFIGGFVAGFKQKEKGWLIGGLTGIGFTIIVFLIQYLGYKQSFSLDQLTYHGGYIFFALIGGVIGVNFAQNNSST